MVGGALSNLVRRRVRNESCSQLAPLCADGTCRRCRWGSHGCACPGRPTKVVQVRQADLIAPTDTADGGVQEFLAQGVHLKTTNATGYARGRFLVGVPLSQATTVDYTWYGTTFAPGVKYLRRRRRRREGRRRAPGGADLRRPGRLAQPGRPGLPGLRALRTTSSPMPRRAPAPSLPPASTTRAAPPAPASTARWPTGQRGSRPPPARRRCCTAAATRSPAPRATAS